MAKKARKTSKAKKRKKSTAPARKTRKAVVRKKAKVARKKPAPKAKPKSVVGRIVGAAEAVVETLSEAEQLHHKMEPHVPPEPE